MAAEAILSRPAHKRSDVKQQWFLSRETGLQITPYSFRDRLLDTWHSSYASTHTNVVLEAVLGVTHPNDHEAMRRMTEDHRIFATGSTYETPNTTKALWALEDMYRDADLLRGTVQFGDGLEKFDCADEELITEKATLFTLWLIHRERTRDLS